MLVYLKLKCFRKHVDRVIQFTPGLNVFRAENEGGKTTILEAVLYALGGARALRESLSEVVTEGRKESELSVELQITINGVDYNITRGASGAEVRYGDQVVTGQTKTKEFLETVIGCTIDTAKYLLIADQSGVKGILEEGNEAGALIERLADLKLIDALVESIQANFSTGSTKALDEELLKLTSSPKEAATKPSQAGIQAAQADLERATAHYKKLKADTAVSATKTVAAKQAVERLAAVQKERQIITRQVSEARSKVSARPVAPFRPGELEAARAAAADAANAARVRKAFETVFPSIDLSWTVENGVTLEKHIKSLENAVARGISDEVQFKEKLAVQKTLLITETTCGLCQKDLTDVPEVVERNSKTAETIKQLEAAKVASKKRMDEACEELRECQRLLKHSQKVRQLASDEFWNVSEDHPPVVTWKGPEVPSAGELPDLKAMEAKQQAFLLATANHESAQLQLAELEASLAALPPDFDVSEAEAVLAEHARLSEQLLEARAQGQQAEKAVTAAKLVYEAQMRLYETLTSQADAAEKRIKELKANISLMVEYNDLIKVLRSTRPEIAKQLWNTLMGSVSSEFSQIRGVASSVTRGDKGFLVNGRSTDGLSGSTQDMLGLSIRMALTRTFIPHLSMLVLDEPFAGCDNEREASALSVLSAARFEQTLLVTHSDLADALADNLLTF